MIPSTRITPHLTAGEVTVHGSVYAARLDALLADPDAHRAIIRVCEVVEVLRLATGPIRVTCGYRPGDEKQHGAGQALDIQCDGYAPVEVMAILWELHHGGQLPHQLRQVIAESTATSATDVRQPMARGSGRWVHVAVMGLGDEPWSTPSRTPWATSCAPVTGPRRYMPWSPPA